MNRASFLVFASSLCILIRTLKTRKAKSKVYIWTVEKRKKFCSLRRLVRLVFFWALRAEKFFSSRKIKKKAQNLWTFYFCFAPQLLETARCEKSSLQLRLWTMVRLKGSKKWTSLDVKTQKDCRAKCFHRELSLTTHKTSHVSLTLFSAFRSTTKQLFSWNISQNSKRKLFFVPSVRNWGKLFIFKKSRLAREDEKIDESEKSEKLLHSISCRCWRWWLLSLVVLSRRGCEMRERHAIFSFYFHFVCLGAIVWK